MEIVEAGPPPPDDSQAWEEVVEELAKLDSPWAIDAVQFSHASPRIPVGVPGRGPLGMIDRTLQGVELSDPTGAFREYASPSWHEEFL